VQGGGCAWLHGGACVMGGGGGAAHEVFACARVLRTATSP
jgi:hypothetical protein